MIDQHNEQLLQYKLSAAELHTLFTWISAKTAFGLPKQLIFPDDEAQADALYQQGFEALVSHGWLQIEEGNKYNLQDELYIYAATMAAPQTVITASRGFGVDTRSITYYVAQGQIVEQYFNHEDQFCILKLPSYGLIEQRVSNFYELVGNQEAESFSVVVDEASAENAIKSKDADALRRLLLLDPDHNKLVGRILNAKPMGQIEIGKALSNRGVRLTTYVLVQDPDSKQVFSLNRRSDQLRVATLSIESIVKQVKPQN